MKVKSSLIIILGLTIGCHSYSFAQASVSAVANAHVIAPISLVKNVDMNFGNIAASVSTGGTVVLAAAGTRATGGSGGVTLPAAAGTVAAASFTVSGTDSYSYAITLPGTVTISNGSNSMTVSSFNSNPSSTGSISSAGTQNISVGATLNVAAGQSPGTYSNSTGVTVTVNYD